MRGAFGAAVYRETGCGYRRRMSQPVQIGDPPIEVVLRRSRRAKRYSLRVSGADRRVSLTMPARASERAALKFAESRESWLRAALDRLPQPRALGFGERLPFRGTELTLCPGEGRRVRLHEGRLLIPGSDDNVAARLRGFLKATARDVFAVETGALADALGLRVAGITLRDTRSRWGSCSESGRLMFSWRLIMAPPGVLRYVAAHEVAHLVEMNHSPAFWALVEQLMPGHAPHRQWLRDNGALLHSYRF